MSLARAGSLLLAAALVTVWTASYAADRRVAGAGVRTGGGAGGATTLEQALVQAYQNNPQINAQRALLRATDEAVPQALSGYRPRVSGSYSNGVTWTDTRTEAAVPTLNTPSSRRGRESTRFNPASVGAQLQQTLFNGFQTANRTRQAEAQVFAARETLRVIEQTVLLDAATVYMNVLRDTAVLELQRRNVEVIQEQLRQTRDRFNVGEVTRTDVAQAESRVAAAQSQFLTAQANLTTSRAAYRRVIGVDPGRLANGTPVDRFVPNSLDLAVAQGQSENPSVQAAEYGVDVAQLQVRVNEGSLYPVVTLTGNVQQAWHTSDSVQTQMSASVVGQVTVPIYQGGAEYSLIRQAKETVGQRRLELAINRDQARANVVQSWGQLDAAKAQIDATRSQVTAAEIALNGVREEARVGQRTTLDVLNATQELLNARVALVTAQRDRVVASYTLLSAVGRLSVPVLGLQVPLYDPMIHYQQVRDAWIGIRTPDGR
ncbi:TolC family outer membrane protein [Pseudorhodoplanes sp.]|jgi:outer membrane protein|uniref:TolC family outer membrane protein n=1 Tax=Pseudorhodoplanes sp. TaxID=1934341 RepID=UPI002CF6FA12|nr:TolC family outer membrane protein [Pseudorhodoplanes sp.]HWV41434.1 TolC family outer membrane protein [Pseudorhodoplanes sp.]